MEIEKYIIGILGIIAMMVVWVTIQALWRKIFADHVVDQDVLAGRSDCHHCSCITPCTIKQLKKEKKKE